MNSETFADRLYQIIKSQGSIAEFAHKNNITDSLLRAYLNKTSLPKLDKLVALANAAGVRLQWLATGEGPVYVKDLIEHIYSHSPCITSAVGAAMGNFVFIPMVSGKISAGSGLEPDNEIDMAVAFRKEWILRKGGPGNMSVIRIQGDSMVPTLQSGDLVLVNHRACSVTVNGGIYAIAVQDEIMIKRIVISVPDGKLRVISDNKNYPEFAVDQNTIIINGKVIWYSRDLER